MYFNTCESEKEAIESLEERIRRLDTIVKDSNDAVIVVELDGVIISWNKGAEQLYGYSNTEVRHRSVFELIPPESREKYMKLFQMIKEGQELVPFEDTRLTSHGEKIQIRTTMTGVPDHYGNIVNIAITDRDLTRFYRILGELEDNKEKLRLLTDEYNAYASRVAHDLHSPLATIWGYLNLISENSSDKDENWEYIQSCLKSTEMAMDTVSALYGLSKLTEVKGLKKSFVSFDQVISETMGQLKSEIEKACAKISVDCQHEAPMDVPLMRQVFQNLLANAIRHHEGEQKPEVIIRSSEQADGIEVVMEDNGPGIPLERRSSLYEAFKCWGEHSGMGLGLSIVKRIVDLHGGHIDVGVSDNLGGAKFTLRFPKE